MMKQNKKIQKRNIWAILGGFCVVLPVGTATAGVCEEASGSWHGSGVFSTSLLSCHYTGTGQLVGGPQFTGQISFKKTDPNQWICWDVEMEISGTCSPSGDLRVETSWVSLDGHLDPGSQHAQFDGVVKVAGIGSGTAHVELQKEASGNMFWRAIKRLFNR